MPELLYMCVAVLALIVNIIKQKTTEVTRSLQMLYKKRRAELHRYARPSSYTIISKHNVMHPNGSFSCSWHTASKLAYANNKKKTRCASLALHYA